MLNCFVIQQKLIDAHDLSYENKVKIMGELERGNKSLAVLVGIEFFIHNMEYY